MEQMVRVRQTHEDGTATVILVRQSACSGDCHKCSGCGAAQETVIFRAENPVSARQGDLVVVKSETKTVMKAVGVFYVAPLLLFFLGYFLGSRWSLGGWFGGFGFLAGIALAVVYDRKVAGKENMIYTITGFAGDALLESMKKGDNSLD